MFPDEGVGASEGAIGEGGGEAGAFEGGDFFSVKIGGIGGGSDLDDRGEDIDELAWLGGDAEGFFGGDDGGPGDDQRGGDTAFVDPMFVFAEGGIADIGPGLAVGDVSIWGAGEDAVTGANGITVAGLFGETIVLESVWRERLERGKRLAWSCLGATAEGFGAGTVVLEVKDQGIFQLSLGLEFGEEATDALVHAVDHGGVDFHATGFESGVGDL